MAVALWAQERLQRQPQGWFALLVPDLASSRHLLQDTLEDVLMPEAVYPGQSETPRPFNISLGVSLAQFPLVDTALQLLHLATSAQRVEQGLSAPCCETRTGLMSPVREARELCLKPNCARVSPLLHL